MNQLISKTVLRSWAAIALVLLLAGNSPVWSQEKKIDASKPTNLYTQWNNAIEFAKNAQGNNLYGYRASFQIASADQHHLAFVEIPFLYNERTSKFGLSDLRIRYFGITHKDYSKMFGGVWAGSVDIFAPTGNFDNGLGTSRWIIAPGLVTGLIFSKKFQSFPIISYQYMSKPTASSIPEANKKVRHGMTLQAITVLNFTSWFIWLTPIYVIPDLSDRSLKDRFILELVPSLPAIGEKFKFRPSAYLRYDFRNESYQARLSLIVYL